MKNHISNVVTHFRGKIDCWDLVNEAVTGNKSDGSDTGEDLSQIVSWGYRNSTRYQICGEDYIIEAFRAARAADPQARLFYNDDWNYLSGKRAAIITMIRKLQAENLIDGAGLQYHPNISPALENPDKQAARYGDFFEMFRRHGALITNVTFWGIADENTWLSEFDSGRPDYPLLFDRNLEAQTGILFRRRFLKNRCFIEQRA
ncbi:MAG: endo-1,4-beta-xylanase [Spirochaetales bacterium]|nr:endo-1,4-beta-xylanase [Spirochaetales bacterium]